MPIPTCTPTEAHARLQQGGGDFVLLDVRELEELAVAAIPGARHIPMRELLERYEELDQSAEIVVMCHHGVRSRSVAEFLAERGFSNVANLQGGIDAWSREVDPSIPTY